jgi:hypothetical protein
MSVSFTFSVCVNMSLHSSGERVAVRRRLNVPLVSSSGLLRLITAAAALLVLSLGYDKPRPGFPIDVDVAFRSIGGITFRGLPIAVAVDGETTVAIGSLFITVGFLAASTDFWAGAVNCRTAPNGVEPVDGGALSRPLVRARLLFCRTKLDSRLRLRGFWPSAERLAVGSVPPTAAGVLAEPTTMPPWPP